MILLSHYQLLCIFSYAFYALSLVIFCALSKCIGPAVHVVVENEHTQPLLINSKAKEQDEDREEENDNAEETKKHVTSIVVAYKLFTPSVKVRNPSIWRKIEIKQFNNLK